MLTPAASAETDTTLWALPCSPTAWALPPPAVQAHVQHLQQRGYQREQQVETRQGRVARTSPTSRKPPSSDAPFHKPPRKPRRSGGPRGARPGHPGHGPTLLSPTEVRLSEPAPGACGPGALLSLAPYYTHPVIASPPIKMDSTHCVLQQGTCAGCGQPLKAQSPPERPGRRWPALDGPHRRTRRYASDRVAPCPSLLPRGLPYADALGRRAKKAQPGGASLVPHDDAMATVARQALVGDMDEPPWYGHNTLPWLWPLTTDTVSLSLRHPHRSKEAFAALLEDWQGLLVSDGYGV